MKTNARVVHCWETEAKPGFRHLFNPAARIGLLHVLLPLACEPGFVETAEAAVG